MVKNGQGTEHPREERQSEVREASLVKFQDRAVALSAS